MPIEWAERLLVANLAIGRDDDGSVGRRVHNRYFGRVAHAMPSGSSVIRDHIRRSWIQERLATDADGSKVPSMFCDNRNSPAKEIQCYVKSPREIGWAP